MPEADSWAIVPGGTAAASTPSHVLLMAIPDFQTIMLPLLRDLEKGERTGPETRDALAMLFQLTPEELAIRLPSGTAPTFANRIGWAKTHLKAAKVIESPKRSVYRLTQRGRELLAKSPSAVTMAVLEK